MVDLTSSLAAVAWEKTTFSLGREVPELVLTSVRCSYICLAGYVA